MNKTINVTEFVYQAIQKEAKRLKEPMSTVMERVLLMSLTGAGFYVYPDRFLPKLRLIRRLKLARELHTHMTVHALSRMDVSLLCGIPEYVVKDVALHQPVNYKRRVMIRAMLMTPVVHV